MLPWNALPWNTIAIIITLSFLIPVIISIILIKIKKYEELGWVIGVFLIILSSITFLYLIPNEIIDNAVIPEDYIWEDEGEVYYWERNTVLFPKDIRFKIPSKIFEVINKREPIELNFIGKEIIHVTKSYKSENRAIIHDAIYDENGEIFTVLNNQEEVSEWYEIDTHLTSLEFVNVEAGRMGIPSKIGDRTVIRVGWVDSNGKKDGGENVVLVREMQRIKTGNIEGVGLAVWQSDISNAPIIWHGKPYICDETLRLTVHPKTGYIVNVYRHLVLSAHLSQFLEIYHSNLLESAIIKTLLKITDPIGEGAELIYETTKDSQARHLDIVKSLDAQLTYYPIIICVPVFIIGLALIWRYCGRSYYWKRYKDFEVFPRKTIQPKFEKALISRESGYKKYRKIVAIWIVFILIGSSLAFVIHGALLNEHSGWFLFDDEQKDEHFIEEIPPTPPGSNRAIDSGRHVLTPLDEGSHKFVRREWWYFNVFFNTPGNDLEGWSMIISFNKMAYTDIRFLKRDNLFMILFDDKGNCYDFSILDQRRGTLKFDSPGINIKFKDSWAKGEYPFWKVHAEIPEKNFLADLSYINDLMPVWVEGRSSNLLIGAHVAGDYYVPRCNVEGTIKWNGKEYTVFGIGYHDHVWETNVPRLVSKGWDWFNLHFDNGWEMYLSKFILRWPKNSYLGALIISPNNRNIVEWMIFSLEYVEERSSQKSSAIKYPIKYHLEASRDDMMLKLDINVLNVCEIVWKFARTGMFEGPCYAKGTFSWEGNTVELNGYGMSEVTRVKYLFSRLNLRERIKEIFSN